MFYQNETIMKTQRFNPTLEKTSFPGLTFYTVTYKVWNRSYLDTQTATFYDYNEAKKFYNTIPLG